MSLEQQAKEFNDNWLDYVCELSDLTEDEAIEAFYRELEHLQEKVGASVTIYRSMIVSEESEAKFHAGNTLDAGRFWSLDKSVAFDWENGGAYQLDFPSLTEGTRILLTTNISSDDIDWVETVACQLGSSYEQEVRLKQDHQIKIEEVEFSHHYSSSAAAPSF